MSTMITSAGLHVRSFRPASTHRWYCGFCKKVLKWARVEIEDEYIYQYQYDESEVDVCPHCGRKVYRVHRPACGNRDLPF